MTAPAYEIAPAVLLGGSVEEADRFLVETLFGAQERTVPVQCVLNWARLLRLRGDDYASHAVTCHY
jgi:hypothetical protein